MIEDRPITVDGWSPGNNDGVYRGTITLARGLCPVEQCRDRAPGRAGRAAECHPRRARPWHRLAADRPARAWRSAPSGVSLLELTAAYAAIAGGRYPVEPRGLPLDEERGGAVSLLRPRRPARRPRATGRRCSTCCGRPPTRAPAAARPCRRRPSARPARPRTTATPCSSALPAIWWSACGSATTTTRSLGKITGGTAPAEIWRRFMASAIAIDGRRGPPLPAEFRIPERKPGAQEPASRRLERGRRDDPLHPRDGRAADRGKLTVG